MEVKKLPGSSKLVTNAALNAYIEEVENNIPDVSGLVTNNALNPKIREIENKIPNHAKCITTTVFNKFSSEIFDVKLATSKDLAAVK